MPRKPRIDKRAIEKHVKDLTKEYERAARKHPVQVPVRALQPGGGGPAPMADDDIIEHNPSLARLLLWLDEQLRQRPHGYADVTVFAEEEGLLQEDAEVLVSQLDQRGLVRNLPGMDTCAARISDSGRAQAQRLKRLQQDRAARVGYAADAFLRWLYNSAGGRPARPEAFLGTPEASFAGAELTEDDLHEAVSHLEEQSLVAPSDSETTALAITKQGVNLVLSGGRVQDNARQRPGTTYNNYLTNPQGVIIGDQQNFTQNNTSGIDPLPFINLAGYVGQINGTLGLSEPQRDELERTARELHSAATDETPEPSRLRQLANQVKAGLMAAGTTIAAQHGIEMATQALATLG